MQTILDWLDTEEARANERMRASIYRLVDLQISRGKRKPEEREQLFAELWATVERQIEMALTGARLQ